MPGIALVQETCGLDYNFGELSIPLFATSCPIKHVCHCHQWHVLDNLSCLRISQVLTLINKTATLWVVGALLLCALYALWYFESIWIYYQDIYVQTFQEILGIWQLSTAGMWRVHCNLLFALLSSESAKYCRECCFTDILWSYACLLISFSLT